MRKENRDSKLFNCRHVSDPFSHPGCSHLRHLPAYGQHQPEHGGQLGLVHRDDPGPALPHSGLRHSLPHQEEQVSDQLEASIHVT